MAENLINQALMKIRNQVPLNEQEDLPVSMLLHKEQWGNDDYQQFHALTKKIDIKWKIQQGQLPLAEPLVSSSILLLYKQLKKQMAENVARHESLKQVNTIVKLIDCADKTLLQDDLGIYQAIEADCQKILASDINSAQIDVTEQPIKANKAKVLPITVLFSEGPIARAYLATMQAVGCKPHRIIQMVAKNDVATKKPVGRFLPSAWRTSYCAQVEYKKMHYWPHVIAKQYPTLRKEIWQQVCSKYHFSLETLQQANEHTPLTHYSDNVETLLVTGLKDPNLEKRLNNLEDTTVLFTGGGIVPKQLLTINNLKFLHIHPGFLPAIRGADCALWSTLLTGHASATCFYMSPGIDAGDIILPNYLPKVKFNLNKEDYDLKTLYRAVYSFYDPWIRSYVLRSVIDQYDNFDQLPVTPQQEHQGTTYYFMHDRLQQSALEVLF